MKTRTQRKTRKTRNQRKRRKTRKPKKNKVRPVIYGGASIKQYGVANALRSLIFTYFPHYRTFGTIGLSTSTLLDKYGLSNKYTSVMDILNQIVHNDDGRYNREFTREEKFGDFLKHSEVLDEVFKDIIEDIKRFLNEPDVRNKISPKDTDIIFKSIDSIQNELLRKTDFTYKEDFPSLSKMSTPTASGEAKAVSEGDKPGRTRISLGSIFSKVSPNDRQTKYPKMCEYLRSMFKKRPEGRMSIVFDFFENAPMNKEDLTEILDLFKQSQEAKLIGNEYNNEIRELQEEIDKK